MKRVGSVALLVGLCLVLSGCFRIEQKIEVGDDGNTALTQVVAINLDDVSAEDLGAAQIPSEDLVCEGIRQGTQMAAAEGDPTGTFLNRSVDDYGSGGYCGVKTSMELQPQFDQSLPLSTFLQSPTTLAKVGEGWEFETQVPTELVVSEIARGANLPAAQTAALLDNVEYKVVVELPGQAVEGMHNASSVSGGTFTWDIDINDAPPRLFATSEPASGFNKLPVSPATLGLLLALFAIVGGVGWFFLRSEPTAAPSAAPTPVAAGNVAANGGSFSAPGESLASAPQGQPYFDETYGIWMLNHPERGLLWHRDGTDEWVPFT